MKDREMENIHKVMAASLLHHPHNLEYCPNGGRTRRLARVSLFLFFLVRLVYGL